MHVHDPQTPCFVCKNPIKGRLTFSNSSENKTFLHMPAWESSHAECYIDLCVRISFEKIMKDLEEK